MIPKVLWWCLPVLLFELGCSSADKVVTGWIHQNDYEKALLSVSLHREFLVEIAPAWYTIGPEGNIENREGVEVGDWRLKGFSLFGDMRVLPLLMNVSPQGSRPDRVRLLFSDKEIRRRHLDQIERLVVEGVYAGVDLDYEGLNASEMTPLAELVEEMASMLHNRRKILAVSLETQVSDNALPGWKRIGEAADEIRLMTYGVRVTEPGPIVPLDWMEARLGKILQVIPPEKLVHGIAIYGLAWKKDYSTNRSSTWEKLMKPALDQGLEIQRDPLTETPWYSTEEETIWCEDAKSIEKKMEISWNMGIRRFAFWRLGGEDPEIWPMIARFLENKRKQEQEPE